MGLAIWMLATLSVAAPSESGQETPAQPAAAMDSGTEVDVASETATDESGDRGKSSSRSAPPPPLGVRFGEPLEDQRFRIAYTFDQMQRKGLLIGDNQVSPSDVLNGSFNPYDRTPRRLEVTAHIIALAYAPHPRATLVVEVPFLMKKLRTRDDQGHVTQEHMLEKMDVVRRARLKKLAAGFRYEELGREARHWANEHRWRSWPKKAALREAYEEYE